MNSNTDYFEPRLLTIYSMYLNGESYALIFPLASKLEAEMNLLIHENGSLSQFDRDCEFYTDVCIGFDIETSKNDIKNDEINQIQRVNRFIEKGYSYQVTEIQMSQLIYRLSKDFMILNGKVLPSYMLFKRENAKRLRARQ